MAAGYLLAFTTTLIWSSNFIVARGMIDLLPPFSFAFYRFGLATGIMLLLFGASAWKKWYVIKENWIFFVSAGFFGIGIFHPLLYLGAHTSPALNLSLIGTISPIVVILINYFLGRDEMNTKKFIAVVFTVLAVVLLISDGDLAKILSLELRAGDGWMLIASVGFACYSALMQAQPKNLPISTALTMIFICGTLWLLPFFVYEQWWLNKIIVWQPNTFYAIAYTAIFASIISYFCWNTAIAKIQAGRTIVIYYLVPVLSAILGYFSLGEAITVIHLASMAMILIGVLLVLRYF